VRIARQLIVSDAGNVLRSFHDAMHLGPGRNEGAYKPARSAAFDSALNRSNVRKNDSIGVGIVSVVTEGRAARNLTNVYML
jgi:hypothetical protein